MAKYFIGLMSGTSMDGIDAVLADFSSSSPFVLASHQHPIPETLKSELHQLCQPGENEINRMGSADRLMGQLFADAVNQLLCQADIDGEDVVAIGCHGQTVRHHPDGLGINQAGFTLQIGDPNTVAVETGIDVIADFRRKDIALGGQGAPLVPAFHQSLFQHDDIDRVILNIGGIANISWLPASGDMFGFDTGPGNTLMDQWCQSHLGQPYDKNGEWAASAEPCDELLNALMSDPYFAREVPKSTGRELFNLDWLQARLAMITPLPADQVQATLAEFTARTIADQINKLPAKSAAKEVWVCGGGARNPLLMAKLKKLLPTYNIAALDDLGYSADDLEGLAFAWLAYRFTERLSGNLPSVTGAEREAVLGGYYPAC
ncbi:anhydro-N-acetylmuramic acid kinase [Corallincola platygyrae]|uniref:Anhydro-N-acetylmuramic acid kinase n=1 Tax=Corallincola platygyrae TaxID=1193278 RepID=A0ABW4XLK4_9GAMM